jgi:hypothetical protein
MNLAEGPGADQFDLEAALAALVRGNLTQFDSCLVLHGDPVCIPGTKAIFRCHFVRSDASSEPRVKALAEQLALEALFHCVPRGDIVRMQAMSPTDQIRESVRLSKETARLWTKSQPNSGEGGELLLYALLEQGLGVPQILSKMSLKTNTNMQIHGTDGVHAKVLPDGTLALYWGEAKIYANLSEALANCITSLSPYLLGTSTAQDTWLIRHYADLGDPEVTRRVLEYFDNNSPKSAEVEVRGACLVGFSHDDYPNLPKMKAELQKVLDATLKEWQAKVQAKIDENKVTGYEIEVFFLPVPSAEDFRAAVMTALQ